MRDGGCEKTIQEEEQRIFKKNRRSDVEDAGGREDDHRVRRIERFRSDRDEMEIP